MIKKPLFACIRITDTVLKTKPFPECQTFNAIFHYTPRLVIDNNYKKLENNSKNLLLINSYKKTTICE